MSWGLCRSCSGLFGQQLHWRARPHAVHRAPALRAFASKKNKSGGRPSLQDVENISRGDAAKSRGTGSRQVPHRLNAEERKLYDLAKQKRYLTLKGSGYRAERKGSPLANIYRQWCDASRLPCILIEQGLGSNPDDTVLVDLSPLRQADVSQLHDRSAELAQAANAPSVEDVREHLPFTIITNLDLPADSTSMSDEELAEAGELAIWQIPPSALAFQCARPEAKQLAADLIASIEDLL